MAFMCNRLSSLATRLSRPISSTISSQIGKSSSSQLNHLSQTTPSFRVLQRSLSTSLHLLSDDKVNITVKYDDETVSLPGKIGDSILDVIVDNEYEIIGYGACEGTVACSTCHVVIKDEHYKDHSKGITEEEIDLLEMISHIRTDTSRLGCQVYLTDKSEGLELIVPPPTDIREE